MTNPLLSPEAIKSVLDARRFTLVGGCFDLLHIAHLRLLEFSARLEPVLVVAVLSDEYIRGYKSPGRPVIPELQRLEMVASLRCVTIAYLSNESPSSPGTMAVLKPNQVVFGEDAGRAERVQWRLANLRQYSPDTRVVIHPRYTEVRVSTGDIIDKIQRLPSFVRK